MFVYTSKKEALEDARRLARTLNKATPVSIALIEWPGAKLVNDRVIHLGSLETTREQADVLVIRDDATWKGEVG